MKLKKGNVIAQVVAHDLCVGCGVCAGICPSSDLTMLDAPNGDLIARWVDGPCATDCGLCVVSCPFGEGVLNPRAMNEEVFRVNTIPAAQPFHEDAGYYDKAYAGFSEANRPTSASGGLLTWTLERLLATNAVDRVAVVVLEPGDIQHFRFVFKGAGTVSEVRQAAGSVYQPVEISELIRQVLGEPGLRWAVTGVPCLCAGVRQAMQRMPKLRRAIRYVFGMVCGMYQNRFYTEALLAAAGVGNQTISKIEFRRKAESGDPSNYRFRATDQRGPGPEIAYHGLPYYLGKNAYFRLNACNACMDVFAEGADACYMDAWLPEYKDEPRGTSLVLVRNPEIRRLLEAGRDDKSLVLDEIAIDKICASQRYHLRRKRHLIDLRQGRKIDPSTGRAFSFGDKLDWFVQRYTQRRSKAAWARVGRAKGLQAFRRSAWDVRLLIKVEPYINRIVNRVVRLVRAVPVMKSSLS